MSFSNNSSQPQPPSQPFLPRPFFEGDLDGFWPQFPTNHPSSQNPDFHGQFDNGPPFKRPRNSENNPTNFSSFPPAFNNPRMNSANPTVGSKGTAHIFYKTRPCLNYAGGNCRNGEHCTYAHGEQEMRPAPENWKDFAQKYGGSGNWNDDQRLIHKMKICKKFYNGEECPYGEKCNFLHERPNPSFPNDHMSFKTEVTRQRESSAISIGTKGPEIENKTDADLQENYRHMSSNLGATSIRPFFRKTKLCSKWEIGQCPFGEKCHFAHGQSELKGSNGHAEVEDPFNSGPIQMKSVAVAGADSSPADVLVGASVIEGEDPNISKWKLNRKINSIYGDWIYDDIDIRPRQTFPGETEA